MGWLAPQVGFEPTTDRLTVDCSTTELLRITQKTRSKTRLIAELGAQPKAKLRETSNQPLNPDNLPPLVPRGRQVAQAPQ